MKLAFLSDLHLNFVTDETVDKLHKEIINKDCDAIVIAGDIADAGTIHGYLEDMHEAVQKPIYFVHGNHDFYGSSFQDVRNQSAYMTLNSECKWVPNCQPIRLTDKSCLCGADGWYDGRYGNFFAPQRFEMPDFDRIQDMKHIYLRGQLFDYINKLGDEYAQSIRDIIPIAAEKYHNIYFVTHIPPFAEAALFQGNPSPDYSVGCFSCKAAGEAFLDMKEKFPDKNIIVLAGHSHDPAMLKIDNLYVMTAEAKNFYPDVYTVIQVD